MAKPGTYRPREPGFFWPLWALLYYLWIALVTLVMGIWWLPKVLWQPQNVHLLGVAWSGQLLAAARIILGIRVEVRGTPPTDDCIIAAKHQSFLDILAIAHSVPQCAFIMKKALLNVPIMGYFARKAGCIPIDRSKGAEAIKQIGAEIRAAQARPEGLGQLVIYPEGTRTKPGEKRKYKHGVSSIYVETGLRVVPVAGNCGMFWPKRGYPFYPGTAVISFLPDILPGLEHAALMDELQSRIETVSDALIEDAGGLPGA